MDFLLAPEAGLWALFLSSFLAATILPGGSEAVLALVVSAHPEQSLIALALATLGNTLGGMITYGMGRLLPHTLAPGALSRLPPLLQPLRRLFHVKVGTPRVLPAGRAGGTASWTERHTKMLECFGPATLLLAWTPVLGDALCAAAGWLRLAWLPCALWMMLGKGLRYAVILQAVGGALST